MRLHQILTTAVSVIALPTALAAQDAADSSADDITQQDSEILVIGGSLRGQVDAAQAPIVELDEQDIAAYGASSIAELVDALAPETGSARGRGGGQRPVFLINGIRVGSFREFRSYPPEAIRKVEVLPEETAQLFGFPPDRRVVNFILQENYSAITADLEYEGPAQGGYARNEQELTLLKITGGGRLNFNIDVEDTSLLTEAERNVIQTESSIPGVAGDPDPAEYRSLIADSSEIEATANWAKAFVDSGSSLSLNATAGRTDTRSLSGLNSVLLTDPAAASVLRTFGADDPLELRSRADSYSTAATYTAPLGDFRLTATADGTITDTRTEIDQPADTNDLVDAAAAGTLDILGALPVVTDGGFAVANSDTYTAETKVTVRGAPLLLPAGELSTTFDVGYKWNRIASSDTRTALDTQLTRGRVNGGLNVVVPITSRRDDAWAAVGDLSLNLQAGVDHLSDFGTLYDWSAGLTWKPFENLDLQATYVNADAAPSLTQLGAAEVTTFNVSTFDFTNNETVLAAITSGGNPDLLAESQKDWKFSANWEVPFIENARFRVDYVRNRSENVSTSFPLLTAEVEAAFADRVTRDASGTLVAIDRRPVTFAETENDRLTFGLSLRGQFGKAKAPEGPGGRPGAGRGGRGGPDAARGGRGRPGAGGGGRGRGGGSRAAARMFGGGDGRGRFFLSLNHTVELRSEVLVANGGPVLDLLNGDALSASGTPRNSTSLQGGMFRNGWGLRVTGAYTGSTRVNGTGLPGSTDLFFDDLATINLRVFANLGQIFDKQDGFLKGFRVSLLANNVFDGRRRVTDSNGDVPLGFQPDLIDPTGRYLGVDLRKLF
ncbi:TonB-dependent receptor [Altererythrobacter sp. ZODW24]|uniref:TonB-dependent receptor n=1 Tax=Altererythrobacter sp. ZODW24 TaxID=2185142 RepID=UPI000DF80EC0|nr:TonB-dependent receptor [Altererythrobacter sp. ZODW24]